MRKRKIVVFFFCILFLLAGCKSHPKCVYDEMKQDSFNKKFSNIEFNKELVMIYFPEESNPFKIGQSLLIAFFNQSLNEIRIDLNKDLQILVFENDEWITFKNSSKYIHDSNLLDLNVPNLEIFNFTTRKITPDIPNIGKSVEIRVVVTGEETIGTSYKQVGAYFDLALAP